MPRQYQSFKEQLHREYYVRTPSCNENKLTKHRFTIVKDVNENLSIDWGEEKNKLRTSIERTQKGTPPGPTKYISRNLCYTRQKVNDLSLIFLVDILFYLVFCPGSRVQLFFSSMVLPLACCSLPSCCSVPGFCHLWVLLSSWVSFCLLCCVLPAHVFPPP